MLTPDEYKRRLIDNRIDQYMKIYGAVCVEGPKWSGKTWTSMNHAVSAAYLGNPANNFIDKCMAEIDSSFVLNGEYPRLIDEWQVVPSLWDDVRYKVDESIDKGRFILTGSSTPVLKGVLHGGSGRIGKIAMRTMSLFETGNSSGCVSILDLFENTVNNQQIGNVTLDQLIEYVVRGGWPGMQGLPLDTAIQIPRDYLNNIPTDMYRLDGKTRDSKKVIALLRALGRAESTMTSMKNLQRYIYEYSEDKINNDSISTDTISDYLDCFRRLFLIEDQPIFENKLRSSIKALKKPKRHFTDPSLAAAALNATPLMLKQDINTFGYLFESLCIHDLRIYAEYYNGNVYHYHDERDNEVDAIVELCDGRWGMIEIKLGFNQVDGAATELLKLKETMYKETKAAPSFLCVICGLSNMAFKRPDGVFVVPITSLGV